MARAPAKTRSGQVTKGRRWAQVFGSTIRASTNPMLVMRTTALALLIALALPSALLAKSPSLSSPSRSNSAIPAFVTAAVKDPPRQADAVNDAREANISAR